MMFSLENVKLNFLQENNKAVTIKLRIKKISASDMHHINVNFSNIFFIRLRTFTLALLWVLSLLIAIQVRFSRVCKRKIVTVALGNE